MHNRAWILLYGAFSSSGDGCYPGHAGRRRADTVERMGRAAGIRARHTSGKAGNGFHLRFTCDRSVREHEPAKRFDRDRVSGFIAVARQPARFRKSLYVNEEASYREASFVDCDASSLPSTSREAVYSHRNRLATMAWGEPRSRDDAPKPIQANCSVVNPHSTALTLQDILPVAAAVLHTVTTSRLSSGPATTQARHRSGGECKRRLALGIKLLSGRLCRASLAVLMRHGRLCRLRTRTAQGYCFAANRRENVRPDVGRNPRGRCLHRLLNSMAAHRVAPSSAPRDAPILMRVASNWSPRHTGLSDPAV